MAHFLSWVYLFFWVAEVGKSSEPSTTSESNLGILLLISCGNWLNLTDYNCFFKQQTPNSRYESAFTDSDVTLCVLILLAGSCTIIGWYCGSWLGPCRQVATDRKLLACVFPSEHLWQKYCVGLFVRFYLIKTDALSLWNLIQAISALVSSVPPPTAC